MILLTYQISPHFEYNTWNKYYCKSLKSAKRLLKDLLEVDSRTPEIKKDIMKQFNVFTLNYKTCNHKTANISNDTNSIYPLNILIEHINLI